MNTSNRYTKSLMGKFRLIAILEGISFLILIFLAMPLKYFAGMPAMVKYTGWAHGVLFVLYIYLLIAVWGAYKWSFKKATLAFIASLLPFGTFFLEKQLEKEYPLSSS